MVLRSSQLFHKPKIWRASSIVMMTIGPTTGRTSPSTAAMQRGCLHEKSSATTTFFYAQKQLTAYYAPPLPSLLPLLWRTTRRQPSQEIERLVVEAKQ